MSTNQEKAVVDIAVVTQEVYVDTGMGTTATLSSSATYTVTFQGYHWFSGGGKLQSSRSISAVTQSARYQIIKELNERIEHFSHWSVRSAKIEHRSDGDARGVVELSDPRNSTVSVRVAKVDNIDELINEARATYLQVHRDLINQLLSESSTAGAT